MADVMPTVGERIELLLGAVLEDWGRVPEVARTIDTWDPADQVLFVVEWPLQEMRLQQFQEHAAAGRLGPAQRARYDELLQLVAQHRPTVERLLQEA